MKKARASGLFVLPGLALARDQRTGVVVTLPGWPAGGSGSIGGSGTREDDEEEGAGATELGAGAGAATDAGAGDAVVCCPAECQSGPCECAGGECCWLVVPVSQVPGCARVCFHGG